MADFRKILEMLGRGQLEQHKNIQDVVRQDADRFKMAANPELQGPPLPDFTEGTPEEIALNESLLGTVMGTVRGPKNLFDQRAKAAAAVRDSTQLMAEAKAGPKLVDVARATDQASRQMAFADRERLHRLKKMLGR